MGSLLKLRKLPESSAISLHFCLTDDQTHNAGSPWLIPDEMFRSLRDAKHAENER